MATPTPSREETGANCVIHTWTLTTADHTGEAIELPMSSDRTIQFTDTSSSWGGATASLEGSLDGTTYFILTDPQGNAISKTDDGLEAVLENVRYLRPRLSVVGTAASVKCVLMSRNQR